MDEARLHDELRRFWDEIARGGPATRGDLDPALAATIRRLHALPDAPPPDPLYAKHLRESLMHATAIPLPLPDPRAIPGRNGRSAPPVRRAILPPLPIAPTRRAFAQLATAALILLTLVGSFFAFGHGRFGQLEEPPVYLPAVSGTPATPAVADGPLAEFLWATEGSPDLPLRTPGYPAVDPQANVWYTDGDNHRFAIFAPDGTFLESWGTEGSGEGEFNLTAGGEGFGGVAFDAAGNIYVADVGNARIQKFAPDRTFLTAWGSRGNADGQFQRPWAIAVDGQGRVAVSDGVTDTIQVFDTDGRWLATWARSGRNPGEVDGPGQLAFDRRDNLWVAEQTNFRVQKFSPSGESQLLVGTFGFDDGQLASPTGLAIDYLGRVFVSDRSKNRIEVFSAEGEWLGGWGESGSEEGQLHGAYGLALDGRGNIFVAEDAESRLQAFRLQPPLGPEDVTASRDEAAVPAPDANAPAELVWAADGEPEAPLGLSAGAGVDSQGNVWVTDGANGRLVIFSPEGEVLETWGTRCEAEGEFDFRCRGEGYGGVAFDAAGNIYVTDAGNGRIQKFAPDRTFLDSWPSEGVVEVDSQFLATGQGNTGVYRPPRCPVAVAIDPQGRVVVSDQDGGEIVIFDADGRPLVTATTERMRPEGVAVDGAGNIWVADTMRRILKFSPDGELLAEWTARGDSVGTSRAPMGIAVDAQGRVYVSDQGDRVQVFAPDGAFLGEWGSHGTDAGQFFDPVALTLDGRGHLYVVEHFGSRVQKFRLWPTGAEATPAIAGTPAAVGAVVAETLFDAAVDGLPKGWGTAVLFRWTLRPSAQALVFPPTNGAQVFVVESGAVTVTEAGVEQQLAAGDVYVVADPAQEVAFHLSGAEEATLLRGAVVTSWEVATADRFATTNEFLLEYNFSTLPGGSGRLVLERLTLPPGSALPPRDAGPWEWTDFAAGTLGLTLEGDDLPEGWTTGEERTVQAGSLWKVKIAPGTRITLRNAGDEPLVLYRMTLTPDATGSSTAGTPAP